MLIQGSGPLLFGMCLAWAAAGCGGSPTATSPAAITPTSPPTLAAPTATTAAQQRATNPAPGATTPSAKPAVKPPAPAAVIGVAACLVGDWIVTNEVLTSSAGQQSGGAGAEWEISSGGAVKVTMSNMKPIIGARGGGVQLSGVSTETIQLPQNASATSGAWVESNRDESHQTTAVVGPDGKVLTTITGGVVSGPDGKPIATVGPSPVVAVQGTWTCTPNGLTIEWTSVTNNNNTGSVTVTLARRTP